MEAWLVRDDVGASGALFAPLGYQLATQAVLAGCAVGTVWVDRLADPRMALMKVGHRLYLAGNSAQDSENLTRLTSALYEHLLPEARAHGDDGFLLYYGDPGWEDVLPATVFAGHTVYPGRRNYWALHLPEGDWQPSFTPQLPGGLAIRAVDTELMSQTDLNNYAALLEEMQSERDSVEDFLSRSFGTVVTSENAVVGWCLSEYNLGDRCEIGIATDVSYQRQGLATLAGIHMIQQGKAKGMRHIGWHCWLRNEGSNATARKLGFEHVNEHGAYYINASS